VAELDAEGRAPAEVAALADAIDPRYRAMVFFDAYCVLRLGELAGLRRGRVDLLRRQVRVTEIAVEVKGQLIFGPPKTRAGYRKVPVPRFVALRDGRPPRSLRGAQPGRPRLRRR
jgi:integrase